MATLKPPPAQRVPFVDDSRQITPPWFQWIRQLNDEVVAGILADIASGTQAHEDNQIMLAFASSDP